MQFVDNGGTFAPKKDLDGCLIMITPKSIDESALNYERTAPQALLAAHVVVFEGVAAGVHEELLFNQSVIVKKAAELLTAESDNKMLGRFEKVKAAKGGNSYWRLSPPTQEEKDLAINWLAEPFYLAAEPRETTPAGKPEVDDDPFA